MKNYLKIHADKGVAKFQEGGAMAAPAGPEGGAPAPQGGGPDIEGMLGQYAQSQDPQLAVQICDALVQMMGAQQGGAPTPQARNGMKMDVNTPTFGTDGSLVG